MLNTPPAPRSGGEAELETVAEDWLRLEARSSLITDRGRDRDGVGDSEWPGLARAARWAGERAWLRGVAARERCGVVQRVTYVSTASTSSLSFVISSTHSYILFMPCKQNVQRTSKRQKMLGYHGV